MADLIFEFEWTDSEGIRGPELSATWASLSVVARGSIVTRLLDHRAKSVRNFVYVPLYPLAEWLATNWWFLLSEFQNPDKQNDSEFRRRHSLGANRDGYAFPDLEVVSSGSKTKLIWNQSPPQWTRIEFLDRGNTWIDASEFFRACFDLIDSVIRRLDSQGINNTHLHDEWAAIQTSRNDKDELEFCETAAALGWDPYDLDDAKSGDILVLATELGELTSEAAQAINAVAIKEQTHAIAAAVEDSKRNVIPIDNLRTSKVRLRSNSGHFPPWYVGYERARDLRHELDLDGLPLPTMSDLAKALGKDASQLNEITRPSNALAKARLIDGVVNVNQDQASFAFRPSGEHTMRFGVCRAVGEIVTSPQTGALLTKSQTERQQCNRAFAAEFLAPSSKLEELVTRDVVDDDEIDDLATQFGVSPLVIRHQIENHHIAKLADPVMV